LLQVLQKFLVFSAELLLLLIACLFWLKNAASRVFELGIRMYGKEPEWSLLMKTFLFARVKE
jgi:ABC-2 type transport system permease protein